MIGVENAGRDNRRMVATLADRRGSKDGHERTATEQGWVR